MGSSPASGSAPRRCVVTGAAGFIGSHLAEHLADQGHDVVGIDCFSAYYAPALKELNAQDLASREVPVHRLDLAEDALDAALDGAEYVIHLAAQPGISASTPFEAYVRNNLTATWRLLEALDRRRDTLRCLVNASTSSVYGFHATDAEDVAPRPASYYGVTKLAAESLALSYHRDRGLPVASMRIFSCYGSRERPEKLHPKLIHAILADTGFPLCEGADQHSRSFSHVSDIVRGLATALERTEDCVGEIFNLGSDQERKTADSIRIIEELLGQRARLEAAGPRAGDQVRTCADIRKARERLGWEPRVTLEEGLREEVDWYRTRIFGKVVEP